MKTKIFCLAVVLSIGSVFGQSGADWAAYKRANGIDPGWTYNAWVQAGCPRNNGGGRNSGPSQEQIAAQQQAAAKAAADKKEQEGQAEQARLAAEAQAAAKKAEHDAEVARQFQKTKAETLAQMKGIASGLDDSSAGGLIGTTDNQTVSGLKEIGSTTTIPLPVDTPTVEAGNVPSGLPKSVDHDISFGYAGAPPGVSDRVRKGFQAITAHDWKVARAWFQDALNHDPANAGLKRLAELADYTEKRIEQNKPVKQADQANPKNNQPLITDPDKLPKDSDILFLFPDWKPVTANPASTSPGSACSDSYRPRIPRRE